MPATALKRKPSPCLPMNRFCKYSFFGSFHSSIRSDKFYKIDFITGNLQ